VLLLALLPLGFYGALYRHSPHAITVGGVASAFSAGGAAIFSMLPARAADQRLTLAGYRPVVLIAGRLIVLEAGSIVISLITAAVMIAGTAGTRFVPRLSRIKGHYVRGADMVMFACLIGHRPG
jgi:hypothetical protein